MTLGKVGGKNKTSNNVVYWCTDNWSTSVPTNKGSNLQKGCEYTMCKHPEKNRQFGCYYTISTK